MGKCLSGYQKKGRYSLEVRQVRSRLLASVSSLRPLTLTAEKWLVNTGDEETETIYKASGAGPSHTAVRQLVDLPAALSQGLTAHLAPGGESAE